MPIMRTTWPRSVIIMLIAVLFVMACLYHEAEPDGFAAMLPAWVPWRLPIIHATAMAEMGFAILLLYPQLRRETGYLVAIYLIVIFPANIYAAFAHISAPGMSDSPAWTLWARLPLQPLLIWLVLWSTSKRRVKRAARHTNMPG